MAYFKESKRWSRSLCWNTSNAKTRDVVNYSSTKIHQESFTPQPIKLNPCHSIKQKLSGHMHTYTGRERVSEWVSDLGFNVALTLFRSPGRERRKKQIQIFYVRAWYLLNWAKYHMVQEVKDEIDPDWVIPPGYLCPDVTCPWGMGWGWGGEVIGPGYTAVAARSSVQSHCAGEIE